MIKDIDSASYYDLEAWCQRLQLESKGGKSDLKNRIIEFYNIKTSSSGGKSDNTKYIKINSSENTQYFKVEEIDETYVKLVGTVSISLEDRAKNENHIISADNILFNQKQKYVTAYGNVLYERKSGSNTDIFKGESLTFDIENWEGIIFKGYTEKVQKSDDKTTKFYYTGDRIIKNKDDNIIMEKGVITSLSNIENPYYSVTADKIWILGPGEWAVENMRLQVGEIPILGFPYFLYWGDHIFFNPNFGTDTQKGFFLQTTTYLLGKKDGKDGDTTFSFMDYNSDSKNFDAVVEGLYIKNKPKDQINEETSKILKVKKELEDKGSIVKLFFDIYPKFGLFTGLRGELKNISQLESFKFFLALGFNPINIGKNYLFLKNLTPDETDPLKRKLEFKPYYRDSYFFNLNLPFRFELETNFKVKDSAYNLEISLPYYSDKDFEVDYLTGRGESFDWKNLMGLSSKDTANKEATKNVPNFKWEVNTSYNIPIKNSEVKATLDKYFNFKIKNINFYIDFGLDNFTGFQYEKNKITNKYDLTKPLDDYYVGAVDPKQNFSHYFYEPKTYNAPIINLSLSGKLLDDKITKNKVYSASTENLKGFLIPDNFKEKKEENLEKKEEKENISSKNFNLADVDKDFKSTKYFENKKIDFIGFDNIFEHNLSYNFSDISFSLSGDTNYENWKYPSEVNFNDMKFHRLQFSTNFNLGYNMNILNNSIKIDNNFYADIKYRDTYSVTKKDEKYSPTSSLSNEEYYVSEDFKFNNVIIRNKFGLEINPLSFLPNFSSTNIRYSLSSKLAELKYDTSVLEKIEKKELNVDRVVRLNDKYDYYLFLPDWNKNSIDEHNLSFNFVSKFADTTQSFSLSADLPPRDIRLTPKFNFNFSFFDFGFSFPVYQKYDTIDIEKKIWEYGDFNFNSSYKLYENNISVSQNFIYNLKYEYLKNSSTGINLNLFENNLQVRQIFDVSNENMVPVANRSETNIKLWYFNFDFISLRSYNKRLNKDTGTWSDITILNHTADEIDIDNKLRPRNINIGLNYKYDSPLFWKNRIKLGFDINANLRTDILQFTNTSIDFAINLNLSIYELLDISFGTKSSNSVAFLYSKASAKKAGLDGLYRNFFEDIAMSFNFFDEQQRKDAYFKLNSLNFKLVHKLSDWDLTFQYSGSPRQIRNQTTGVTSNNLSWASTFSIFVEWRSIGLFKTSVKVNEESRLLIE